MIYQGIVEMTLRERLLPLVLSLLLIAIGAGLLYCELAWVCAFALWLRDLALCVAGALAGLAAGVVDWFAGALVPAGWLVLSFAWLILRILAVAATAAMLLVGLFLLWVYGIAPALAGLRRGPA